MIILKTSRTSISFAIIVFAINAALNTVAFAQSRSSSQSILLDTTLNTTKDTNYCVSIRGNGFRALAHVGALAQTVEAMGIPQGMAGGSSSTLTMYLADQIFQNPLALENAEKTAFLFKVVDPVLNEYLKRPEIETAKALITNAESQEKLKKILYKLKEAKGVEALPKILKLYFTESVFRDFVSLIQSRSFKTLANIKAIDNIMFSKNLIKTLNVTAREILGRDLTKEELQELKIFRSIQFQEAIEGLMSFKVADDSNFLFREGLIKQGGIAKFLEPVARFLGAKYLEGSTYNHYKKFLENCSQGTRGLVWSQIKSNRPTCEKDLTVLAQLIFSEHEQYYHWKANNVSGNYEDQKSIRFRTWKDLSLEKIGKSMPMFGMTSLLKNESVDKFIQWNKQYLLTTDANFGFQFQTDAKDFGVGYWGQQAGLLLAEKNLGAVGGFRDRLGRSYNFSQDEKSKRFTNLGEINWEDLMKYSATEPGTGGAAQVTTDVDGEAILTTGGWFDHLSAPMLKASGCDQVVAITRNKGDTKYGQEVYARLLFNGGKNISEITDSLVQIGDENDQTSLWSRLFNFKNPMSSINLSLRTTDVVICSFWEDLTLNSSSDEIFNVGYSAGAYFERTDSAISKSSWPGRIIEKTDDLIDEKTGIRLYSGCISE